MLVLVIDRVGLNLQLVLGVVLAVVAITLLLSKNAVEIGFTLWIWLFALGYRTIHLTSYWKIHPLSLFLLFLFVLLLLITKFQRETLPKMPKVLWVFSIFWLWGFIMGVNNNIPWDRMISDALNFILIIPLFVIIFYLSLKPGFQQKAMLHFLGVGALISILGALEYFFPEVRTLVPGFMTNPEGRAVNLYGFNRAQFSFFGAVTGILISALAFPAINLLSTFKSRAHQVTTFVIAGGIIAIGIYISGTRVAWLLFIITSLLLVYFNFSTVGGILGLVAWGVIGSIFPQEAVDLFLSVFQPLRGERILDSSLNVRVSRQQDALRLALDHPFGVGWAGSGWVHGDFAQVAANLGLLAGVFFLGWYLFTLYRTYQLQRKRPEDKLLQTLFISFILCGVILATEGVQVLTQMVMPVWFVWGLVEAYLRNESLTGKDENVSS
jgi:O-antigen ligase